MRILGLSGLTGEGAAALLEDGVPVAAAQEERFTRIPRDASFPRRAIRACLRIGRVEARALDWVVFQEKPLRRFERVLASQLRAFPRSAGSFASATFLWLGDRLWLRGRIASELGVPPERVLFTEHHQAHAASAFWPSPFEDAAVLVADGAGEWATTSLHRAGPGGLEPLGEVHFPHSLGLFVGAMAEHLGLPRGGGEARLMELAAHGRPTRRAEIDRLLRPAADGTFELDLDAFRFDFDGERLCAAGLQRVLGPPRAAGAPLRWQAPDAADADLAASVQSAVEERLLALAAELHRRAPSENLCFGGDLAGNAAAVGRLIAEGPFRRVFVPPAPGDAGAALGAALHAHRALDGHGARWRQQHAFLGEDALSEDGEGGQALPGEAAILDTLLARLQHDGLVGWVRGRFEWGPRSLGHRSLLADPGRREARDLVSRAVKRREEFRPFAPALPAERAAEFLDVPAGAEWPARFMQACVPARDAARAAAPAAVHADGRARPQLVHAAEDPLFHALLQRFGERTGAPLLLQTSLNLRGDPPVRNEADALTLLRRSALPALVVEDRLYLAPASSRR